jgi:hypothetical protein
VFELLPEVGPRSAELPADEDVWTVRGFFVLNSERLRIAAGKFAGCEGIAQEVLVESDDD